MKVTCVAIAALSLLAGSVQAAPIMGTGSVALFGVRALPPMTVIDTDSIFSFVLSSWSDGTGDLDGTIVNSPTLGSPLTTATVKATLGEAASFSASFGSFSGFITQVNSVGGLNNRTVSFYALGDFIPTFGGFTAGPMSMTFSATQTGGSTAAISASYTIASPPVSVPEPTSLALVGLAIAGLGFATKRRRA